MATPESPVWTNSAFLTQRLRRHAAGPFGGGGGGGVMSLCKPFILFQAVCPQPSTIQFAHSPALSSEPWRKTTGVHVIYQSSPKPTGLRTQDTVLGCVCVHRPVHARGLLTCSFSLHLNDTFWVLARLPGVEGPDSNNDFYRSPRHVCGLGRSPGEILNETQRKWCLHW